MKQNEKSAGETDQQNLSGSLTEGGDSNKVEIVKEELRDDFDAAILVQLVSTFATVLLFSSKTAWVRIGVIPVILSLQSATLEVLLDHVPGGSVVRHPVLHVSVDSVFQVTSQDKRSNTGTNIADQDEKEEEAEEFVNSLFSSVLKGEEDSQKNEGSDDDDEHRSDEVLTREEVQIANGCHLHIDPNSDENQSTQARGEADL